MKFPILWMFPSYDSSIPYKVPYPIKVPITWKFPTYNGSLSYKIPYPMTVLILWRFLSYDGSRPMTVLIQWRFSSYDGSYNGSLSYKSTLSHEGFLPYNSTLFYEGSLSDYGSLYLHCCEPTYRPQTDLDLVLLGVVCSMRKGLVFKGCARQKHITIAKLNRDG